MPLGVLDGNVSGTTANDGSVTTYVANDGGPTVGATNIGTSGLTNTITDDAEPATESATENEFISNVVETFESTVDIFLEEQEKVPDMPEVVHTIKININLDLLQKNITTNDDYTFSNADVEDWKTGAFANMVGEYEVNTTTELSKQVIYGLDKLFQKEVLETNQIGNSNLHIHTSNIINGDQKTLYTTATNNIKFDEQKVGIKLNETDNNLRDKIASNDQLADIFNYATRSQKREIVLGKIIWQSGDVLIMYLDVQDSNDDANTNRWAIKIYHTPPSSS